MRNASFSQQVRLFLCTNEIIWSFKINLLLIEIGFSLSNTYVTVSKYTAINPDLLEDGFESSPPWFFGLIAERAGRVVGHAMCNRAYSSWTRRAFYLEDLYVRPEARRAGVALRLLEELCKVRKL